MYRAQESERSDAVFRDPYARKLAGATRRGLFQRLGGEAQRVLVVSEGLII